MEKILISEIIVSEIRQAILEKKYVPGDKLPTERQLAELYSASRIPVREALKTLAQMGLVESIQGKGTFVTNPDSSSFAQHFLSSAVSNKNSIVELLQLRRLIETQAAKDAALKRSNKELLEIQRLEKNCQECLSGEICRFATFQNVDFRFHMAIAKASKNELFQSFIKCIADTLHLHQSALLVRDSSEIIKSILLTHSQIVKAIAEMDSERAGQFMEEHMIAIENVLLKMMN